MQKQRRWGWLMLAAFIVIGGATPVFAADSSSSHYQVIQTQFGSASNQQTCSSSYCSKTTIGDMSGSDASDGTLTAKFGPAADGSPLLEVIVSQGASDLGILDPSTTATTTMLIKVRNYLSSGYTLQINGDPPKTASHTLSTLATPTASSPGKEQFGINAVANTAPSVGAAPAQVPSSAFSFGTVNDDYKTANLFKYISGDTVARSDSSSGETDYTVSMIVNVSNATPAGHYGGDFSAVVVPVY